MWKHFSEPVRFFLSFNSTVEKEYVVHWRALLLYTTCPAISSSCHYAERISCKITESWKLESVVSQPLENVATPFYHKLYASIDFLAHVTFTCIGSKSALRISYLAPAPHQVQAAPDHHLKFFKDIFFQWGRLRSVAWRGLVMPGTTAWVFALLTNSRIEQWRGVWWSMKLVIRCLWRHFDVCRWFVEVVNTACISFYTHSPYLFL